jgi:hypothetical protein
VTTAETLKELINGGLVQGTSETRWRDEEILRDIYAEEVQEMIFAPNGLAETVSEIVFAAELELRSVSTMVQLAELDSGAPRFECSESLGNAFVDSMRQDTVLQDPVPRVVVNNEDSSVVVRDVVLDPFDGLRNAYCNSVTLGDDVQVKKKHIKDKYFQARFKHAGLNELQSGAIEKRKQAMMVKLTRSQRLHLAWQKARQIFSLFADGRLATWGSALVKFISMMGLSFTGTVPASVWFLAYFSAAVPHIFQHANDLLEKTGATTTDVIQVVRSHDDIRCFWERRRYGNHAPPPAPN